MRKTTLTKKLQFGKKRRCPECGRMKPNNQYPAPYAAICSECETKIADRYLMEEEIVNKHKEWANEFMSSFENMHFKDLRERYFGIVMAGMAANPNLTQNSSEWVVDRAEKIVKQMIERLKKQNDVEGNM